MQSEVSQPIRIEDMSNSEFQRDVASTDNYTTQRKLSAQFAELSPERRSMRLNSTNSFNNEALSSIQPGTFVQSAGGPVVNMKGTFVDNIPEVAEIAEADVNVHTS